MQRTPEIDYFFCLPAPPRRLDLSQDVLRTTECAPDRSGNARFIHGRVVKSPAARARRTLFSIKIVLASTILVLPVLFILKKFSRSDWVTGIENRKNGLKTVSNSAFNPFSDFFFSKKVRKYIANWYPLPL